MTILMYNQAAQFPVCEAPVYVHVVQVHLEMVTRSKSEVRNAVHGSEVSA